jgi:hypothetical protein
MLEESCVSRFDKIELLNVTSVISPEYGLQAFWNSKAKVDTGARSSSLHVVDLEEFMDGGRVFVRFNVHPLQRTTKATITAEAEVLEYRNVRSSSGQRSRRPVIVTNVLALGQRWPIELTLANRDEMGFRMLLGREAVRGRFLVDAGRSYYGGKPAKSRKMKKKKRAGGQGTPDTALRPARGHRSRDEEE